MAELDRPTIYNVNVTWADRNLEERPSLSGLFFIQFPQDTIRPSIFHTGTPGFFPVRSHTWGLELEAND